MGTRTAPRDQKAGSPCQYAMVDDDWPAAKAALTARLG
jgi:hypothetical protein